MGARHYRAGGGAAALVLMGSSCLTPVYAEPAGGNVVGGSGSISQAPGATQINQSSERLIVEWQSFDTDQGETVEFVQPDVDSAALNRILSGTQTSFDGELFANGNVLIINPAGVHFGEGAVVDVGGLIASSAGIGDENFMAGRLVFDQPGQAGAVVTNSGTINARDGGLVALVAPGVENSGAILADLGTVVLGSGETFAVDPYGDGLVSFAITGSGGSAQTTSGALVSNSGRIQADGGAVILSAQQMSRLVDNAINMSGVIQANSVGVRDGVVVLYGGDAGAVNVSGQISAQGLGAGETGGTVHVAGEALNLTGGARIDASGAAGGGTILVGGAAHGGALGADSPVAYSANGAARSVIIGEGARPPVSGAFRAGSRTPRAGDDLQNAVFADTESRSSRTGGGAMPRAESVGVSADAVLAASARDQGGGGDIVVWSDGATRFDGTAIARGGAAGGDGGFVETSGLEDLTVGDTAYVDALAPNGMVGDWLLDPRNIEVATGGGASLAEAADDTDTTTDITIAPSTIEAAAANVTLWASEDITFTDPVAMTNAGVALTARAGDLITVNASIATNNGDITLISDDIDINDTVHAGTGTLILDRATPGTVSIESSLASGYDLQVSELALVEADKLVIGRPNAADNNVSQLGLFGTVDASDLFVPGVFQTAVQLNALADAASSIVIGANADHTYRSVEMNANAGVFGLGDAAITATTGNLAINANEDGSSSASDVLQADAGTLTLSAARDIVITANDYREGAGGSLVLNAGLEINLWRATPGTMGVGDAVGDMTISNAQIAKMTAPFYLFGSNSGVNNVTALTVDSAILGGDAQFTSAGAITFNGASTFDWMDAHADGALLVNAASGDAIQATGQVYFRGKDTVQISGDINAARIVISNADTAASDHENIVVDPGVSLTATDDLIRIFSGDDLTIGAGATISAPDFVYLYAGEEHADADGDMDIAANAAVSAPIVWLYAWEDLNLSAVNAPESYYELYSVYGALTLDPAGGFSLESMYAYGDAGISLGGTIQTATHQYYDSPVTLTGDTVLTSTDGGDLTFASTLDGAHALTMNTAGWTWLGGAVGATTPLVSLTTDAPGTTYLGGPTLDLSGNSLTFNDAVILRGSTTIADAGDVAFNSTVDSETGEANALTVNAGGDITFGGAVGATDQLSVLTAQTSGGGINLDGGSVQTTGAQTYTGLVALGADATLTSTGAGDIGFGGAIDGAYALTVNTGGVTTFGGAVGGTAALTGLTTDVGGLTLINGGAVTTSGNQYYGEQTQLGADTILTSTGGDIEFVDAVSGPGAGLYDLTVQADRTVTARSTLGFIPAVGIVGVLRVSADEIDLYELTSARERSFLDGAIILKDDVVIGGWGYEIHGSIDGPHNLQFIYSSDSVVDAVIGGDVPLSSLHIRSTPVANGGDPYQFLLSGGSVTTVGEQTYDWTTLGADTVVTSTGGGNIIFGLGLDGAHALTVNTSGATHISGDIGATTPLHSITTDAAGSTRLGFGSIFLSGNSLTLNDPVTLGSDVTITDAGAVTFNSTLDSESGNRRLEITAGGDVSFNGAVGASQALAALDVTASGVGSAINLNGGSVLTTDEQTYSGATRLGADTTLTSNNAGDIGFTGTVDGAYALTVNTGGVTTFGGVVGGTTALASLTTDAGGSTLIGGGAVTTSGDQYYGDAVEIGADATLTSTGGDIELVDNIGGEYALTINAEAGTVTVSGSLGDPAGSGLLGSLQLTANAIELSNQVHSSGRAIFDGAVTLNDNVLMSTAGLELYGSVDGPYELYAIYSGDSIVDAVIGANDPLASVTFVRTPTPDDNDPTQTYLGAGSVTTIGDQNFYTVTLTADTILTSTGGGQIYIGDTLDGAYGLTVNTSGITDLGAVIGGATPLTSLTTDSGGTTLISGGAITLSGNTATFNDAVILEGDTTITDAGAVAFNSTVDSESGETYSLSVAAGGDVTFGGAVGGTDLLSALTADSGGGLTANGAISTDNGDILFTADAIAINAAMNAGTGIVTLAPHTAGRKINLGEEDASYLSLTDAEFDLITAGLIRVGSASAGSIFLRDVVSPAGTDTLSLITGDRIVDTNVNSTAEPGDIAVVNLALSAVNGIGWKDFQDPDFIPENGALELDVSTVAAVNTTYGAIGLNKRTQTGSITPLGLTIGTVDGVAGVQNLAPHSQYPAGLEILVWDSADLTIANDVVNSDGGMSITTKSGGNIVLQNGADIRTEGGEMSLYSNNMSLEGGTVTASGNQQIVLAPEYNRDIAIGGADDAGTLGLSAAELDVVTTAGLLVIGTSYSTNDITLAGPVAPANVTRLKVEAGDSILDGTATEQADITIDTLTLIAGDSIGTATDGVDLDVQNLSFSFASTGALSLTNVDGVTLSGPVNAASILLGGAVLNLSGAVTTSGSQTYEGPISLAGDTTLTSTGAGDVTFASSIQGGRALTVNTQGATVFEGAVGQNSRLTSLMTDAGGTTRLNYSGDAGDPSLRTTGGAVFGDSVILGGNLFVSNLANNTDQGGITFAGTLDGDGVSDRQIAIDTRGAVTFGGAVGSSVPVGYTQVRGYDGIFLNGGAFTSTAGQSYFGDVVLGADTVLTSNNDSAISFYGLDGSSANGGVNGAYALTVVTGGETRFFTAIGDTTPLISLTTDAGGSTLIGGGAITLSGNTATFNDAVILNDDTTITDAGAVTFNNTVDSETGEQNALTVDAGGDVTFAAAVGGTTPLSALTIMSGGVVSVASITTGNGDIGFFADDIALGGAVNAGTGIVTLAPFTAGRTISLGTDVIGSLSLTDAEIDQIIASILRIGSASAGSITINSGISPAGTNTLSLITGDEILDGYNAGTDITVANLALQAANGIGHTGASIIIDTDIDTLAALNTTSGAIGVIETFGGGDLAIGTVDGVVGVRNDAFTGSNPAFAVQIETNDGDLTVNDDVYAQRRRIFLQAQSGNGGANDSLFANNAAITAAAAGGEVEIFANNMALEGGAISAGRRVTLQGDPSATVDIAIDLGGADGVNTLGLTDAELDTITTAGVLQIGSASSGDITITEKIDPAGVDTLALQTGGAVLDGDPIVANDLLVQNLAIRAGAGIGAAGADLDLAVDTFAFSNGAGDVNIENFGDLTIGAVDGLTASSNAGTTTQIWARLAGGNLTIASDVFSNGDATYIATNTLTVQDTDGDPNTGPLVSGNGAIALNAPQVSLYGDIDAAGALTGDADLVYIDNETSAGGAGNGAEIQDGVDIAAVGATVNVAAGSYSGFTVDTANLLIDGAGAATIVNAASPAVTIAANGVTVQDMTLAGTGLADQVGVLLDGTAAPDLTGVSIVNVDFANLDDGVRSQGDIGDGNAATTDVTIRGNSGADKAVFEDFLDVALDVGDTDGDAVYLVRDVVVRDGADGDTVSTGDDGFRFGSVGGAKIKGVEIGDATGHGVVFDTLTDADVLIGGLAAADANTIDAGAGGVVFADISGGSVVIAGNTRILGAGAGLTFGGVATGALTNGAILGIVDNAQIQNNTHYGVNIGDVTDSTVAISGNDLIMGTTGYDGVVANGDQVNSSFTIGPATVVVDGVATSFGGNLQIIGSEALDIDSISGGTFTVANNGLLQSITNDGDGIEFDSPISNGATVVVAGNTIVASDDDGIDFISTITDSTVIVTGNDISGANEHGILITREVANSTMTFGPATVDIDGVATSFGANIISAIEYGLRAIGAISGTSELTIADNTFEGAGGGRLASDGFWFEGGILDTATVTLDGNTVTADGIAINVADLQSPSTLDIVGGTYDGTGGALLVDNSGVAGTNGRLNLGSADYVAGAGVNVIEVVTDAGNAGVGIDFAGGATITGGANGLVLTGPGIDILDDTLGSIAFSGQSGDYVQLSDEAEFQAGAPIQIDATGVSFDGATGPSMTPAEMTALEGRLVHYPDNLNSGVLNINDLYVTNGESIQYAVNAAGLLGGPQTVVVGDGTFAGSVEVWVNDLTLVGNGDTTIIDTDMVDAFANDGAIFTGFGVWDFFTGGGDASGATGNVSGVTIDGFHFTDSTNAQFNGGVILGTGGFGTSTAIGTTVVNSSFEQLFDAVWLDHAAGDTLLQSLFGMDLIAGVSVSGLSGGATLTLDDSTFTVDAAALDVFGQVTGADTAITVTGSTLAGGEHGALFDAAVRNGATVTLGGTGPGDGNTLTGGDYGVRFSRDVDDATVNIIGNAAIGGANERGVRFRDVETSTVRIADNALIVGDAAGVEFRELLSGAELTIDGNTQIQGLGGDGIFIEEVIGSRAVIADNAFIRGATTGPAAGVVVNEDVEAGAELAIVGNGEISGNAGIVIGDDVLDSRVDIAGNTLIQADEFPGVLVFDNVDEGGVVNIGPATVDVAGVSTAYLGNTTIASTNADGVAFDDIYNSTVNVSDNGSITGDGYAGVWINDDIENSGVTIARNQSISGADEAIAFGGDVSDDSVVLVDANRLDSPNDGVRFFAPVEDDTSITFTDNVIGDSGARVGGDGIRFDAGILDSATVVLERNTIYADGLGLYVSDLQSPSTLSLVDGTFDGTGGALLVDNSGVAGSDGRLNLGAASYVAGAGANVVEVVTDTGNAGVDVAFNGAATISGGANGVVLTGPGIDVVSDTFGNVAFSGQSDQYIVLSDAAEYLPGAPTVLDVQSVSFDGQSPGTMSAAQLIALETSLTHYLDNGSTGLLYYGALVVPDGGSIQLAVNAAGGLGGAQTVVVDSGTFGGSVEVWVPDLRIVGLGVATVIDANALDPFANRGDVDSGFDIDADGVTLESMLIADGAPGTNLGLRLDGVTAAGLTGIEIRDVHFADLQTGVAAEGDIGAGAGSFAAPDVLIAGNSTADRATFTDVSDAAMSFDDASGADAVFVVDAVSVQDGADLDANSSDTGISAGRLAGLSLTGSRIVDTNLFAVDLNAALTGATVQIGGSDPDDANVLTSEQTGLRAVRLDGSEMTVAGNTIEGGALGGFDAVLLGTVENGSLVTIAENTRIASATGRAVTVTLTQTGSQIVIDANGEISGEVDALRFVSISDSRVDVTDNPLIDGDGDAIDVGSIESGAILFIADNARIQGGDNGVRVGGVDGATVEIRGNDEIAATAGQGVETGDIENGGALIVAENPDIQAGGDGVRVGNVDASSVDILENDLIAGGGTGVAQSGAISGGATFTVADNGAVRGQTDGVATGAVDGGDLIVRDNDTIDGVAGSGVVIGGGALSGALVVIGDNGEILGAIDGVTLDVVTDSEVLIAGNSRIVGSAGDGVRIANDTVDSSLTVGAGSATIGGVPTAFDGNGEVRGGVYGVDVWNVADSSVSIAENGSLTGGDGGVILTDIDNSTIRIADNASVAGEDPTFGDGIVFDGYIDGGDVTVTRNEAVSGARTGMVFVGDLTGGALTVSGNGFTGSTQAGVAFEGGVSGTSVQFVLNTLAASSGDGLRVDGAVEGGAVFTLTGDAIGAPGARVGGDGIAFAGGVLDGASVTIRNAQVYANDRALSVDGLQSSLAIDDGAFDGTGGAVAVDNGGAVGADGELAVRFANFAAGAGARVFSVVTDGAGGGVLLDVTAGGSTLTGGATGLYLSGAGIDIAGDDLVDTAFAGQSGDYIELANAAEFLPGAPTVIDARDVSFDGQTPAGMSVAELTALEGRLTHYLDNASTGLLYTGALVVPDGNSIQLAVNAAGALGGAQTVIVDAGTFGGSVELWVDDLTLIGQGDSTLIDAGAVDPFANNGDVDAGFQIAATSALSGGGDASGLTVESLAISGGGANRGVYLGAGASAAADATLRDIRFADLTDGVVASRITGATTLANLAMTNMAAHGVHVLPVLTANNSVTMSGSDIDADGDAVAFAGATGGAISIADSTLTAGGAGVNFAGDVSDADISLAGSTVASGGDGLRFAGAVTGSQISVTDSTLTAGGAGASFADTVTGSEVSFGGATVDSAEEGVLFAGEVQGARVGVTNSAISGADQALQFAGAVDGTLVDVSGSTLTAGAAGLSFTGPVTLGEVTVTGSTLDAGAEAVLFAGALDGAAVNILDSSLTGAGGPTVAFSGPITGGGVLISSSALAGGGVRAASLQGDATFTVASSTIGADNARVGEDGLTIGAVGQDATLTLTENLVFADGRAAAVSALGGLLVMSGGTYDGADGALVVDNSGAAGAGGRAALDSVALAGGAGSRVFAVLTAPGGAGAELDLTAGGVSITGGDTGLVLSGPGVDVAGDTLGDTRFAGQAVDYIELAGGAEFLPGAPTLIDITDATFNGKTPGEMSFAELVALESSLTHYLDNGSTGLLRYGALVVPDGDSVQLAVNAAGLIGGAQTVQLDSGVFAGSVEVWVDDLTISGQGAGTVIDAGSVDAFANNGDVGAGLEIAAVSGLSGGGDVSGVAVDGVSFAGGGAGTGVALGREGVSTATDTTLANTRFSGLVDGVTARAVGGVTWISDTVMTAISDTGVRLGLLQPGATVRVAGSDIAAGQTGIGADGVADGAAIVLTGNDVSAGGRAVRVLGLSGELTIDGGAYDGADGAVMVDNRGRAGATGLLTVGAADLAADIGGTVLAVLTDAGNAGVGLDLSPGGVTLNGGATGMRLAGPGADIAGDDLHDLAFAGQSENYIVLQGGAEFLPGAPTLLDATGVDFEGLDSSNFADIATIEDRLVHYFDDASLGLILVHLFSEDELNPLPAPASQLNLDGEATGFGILDTDEAVCGLEYLSVNGMPVGVPSYCVLYQEYGPEISALPSGEDRG